MAERVERMWCPQCGDFRRSTSPGTNHLLHLAIVVLLFRASSVVPEPLSAFPEMAAFAWVIVWVIASFDRSWRCGECGTRAKGKRKPQGAGPSVVHKAGKALRSRQIKPESTGVIPQRPSALHETARAEWDAKYGKK